LPLARRRVRNPATLGRAWDVPVLVEYAPNANKNDIPRLFKKNKKNKKKQLKTKKTIKNN
jgi:hypothetical protein